jgi:hypothetical protein
MHLPRLAALHRVRKGLRGRLNHDRCAGWPSWRRSNGSAWSTGSQPR